MSLVATACQHDLDEIDGIFYNGDGRKVHCGANLDDRSRNSIDSIDSALDRAAAEGEVVELYAHNPGVSVPVSRLEHVLERARTLELPFVTYADFAAGGGTGAGLALAFDDAFVQAWTDLRPLLQSYGARVTFFVSRYPALDLEQRAQLRQLADDGHDIAAHSILHLRAPTYVEDNGLATYLDDEVVPSIELLREAGFPVTAFAYPFGARTSEIDDAILEHVPIVRSVAFSYYGTVQSPCPN